MFHDRRDQQGNPVNSMAWLQHRCELFEKYTLPSILSQTHRKFKWLLLFDVATPKSVTEKYAKADGRIRILHNSFADFINDNQCDSPSKYVVTTRIDNDDVYLKHHLEQVHEEINKHKPGVNKVLVDSSGYQYNEGSGEFSLYDLGRWSTPFLTLSEPYGAEIDTVIKHNHEVMNRHYKCVKMNEPSFVQIIHERNLMNEFAGKKVSVEWKDLL